MAWLQDQGNILLLQNANAPDIYTLGMQPITVSAATISMLVPDQDNDTKVVTRIDVEGDSHELDGAYESMGPGGAEAGSNNLVHVFENNLRNTGHVPYSPVRFREGMNSTIGTWNRE